MRSEGMQKQVDVTAIQNWMIDRIAALLEIDPEEVEVDVSFDRYGLGSSMAYSLTGDLADWLGYDLDPTIIYNYPTIAEIAEFVHSEIKTK